MTHDLVCQHASKMELFWILHVNVNIQYVHTYVHVYSVCIKLLCTTGIVLLLQAGDVSVSASYECMNELMQDPSNGNVQVLLANGQLLQVVLADIQVASNWSVWVVKCWYSGIAIKTEHTITVAWQAQDKWLHPQTTSNLHTTRVWR